MNSSIISGIYRREGQWNLIELKISHAVQLFNSFDPSPFRERDLDADAAEYLVDAMRELHGHRHVRIVVYLPGAPDPATESAIRDAIHNFFRYRELAARFAVRQSLRLGRASLGVGLVFLTLCMATAGLALSGDSVTVQTLREGLFIIGWVAMWRPLDILLYEWWPPLRDARLYRRISDLPVEVRSAD